MCHPHYKRQWKLGERAVKPSVADRLAAKLVRMPNGCLEWTGTRSPDGYGRIWLNRKFVRTHRLAWELANGPIPEGMFICHRCDNPPCCDVEKCLFLGSHDENMADMDQKDRGHRGDYNVIKTHCPQGHEYAGANLYITTRGGRICRTCQRAAILRFKAKFSPKGNFESAKTHCPRGHEYAGDNLYRTPNSNGRECRECIRITGRARAARKKAQTVSIT